MKFMDMLREEHANMPSYQRKFSRFFLVAFAVILGLAAVTAVLCVVFGVVYGWDSSAPYIPIVVLGAILAVWMISAVAVGIPMGKRVQRDRAAELEQKYCRIPIEEAERALKEIAFIADEGFIYDPDESDIPNEQADKVYPFDKCSVFIDARYVLCKMEIYAVIYSGGLRINCSELTCELYNFIIEKNITVINRPQFDMLAEDKKKFFESLLKNGAK